MMSSAYGMPILSNAATNGEAATLSSFHGTIVTSRNTEPTKKTKMRMITELAALATARSGSEDSAAAIVAISGAHHREDHRHDADGDRAEPHRHEATV